MEGGVCADTHLPINSGQGQISAAPLDSRLMPEAFKRSHKLLRSSKIIEERMLGDIGCKVSPNSVKESSLLHFNSQSRASTEGQLSSGSFTSAVYSCYINHRLSAFRPYVALSWTSDLPKALK